MNRLVCLLALTLLLVMVLPFSVVALPVCANECMTARPQCTYTDSYCADGAEGRPACGIGSCEDCDNGGGGCTGEQVCVCVPEFEDYARWFVMAAALGVPMFVYFRKRRD